MTGGSTLMGVIVQRLVEDVQKMDRPVICFAFVDHCPSQGGIRLCRGIPLA